MSLHTSPFYYLKSRNPKPVKTGQVLHDKNLLNKLPTVYILASQRNGTIYTGVTSNLAKRVWEHRNHLVEGFTQKYDVHKLVWYEVHDTMESAILREKRLKKWKRRWKLELIEKDNPDWSDLYETVV